MTGCVIRRCNPRDPGASALLRASHGLMDEMFPAETGHYLSVDGLAMPGIHFFLAERGGRALGCVALAERRGYAEVRSMFVDPDAREMGLGDQLLDHVTEVARSRGFPMLRLEAGDGLDAALRLYQRHGFTPCGRFGEYPDSPHSIFMEKAL
ncbi:MAG: GNAT family N-acetyltransferase [Tropicimonas sp.]|uniref:GNAT family N-acetyltransferase n=1 Tax=Tropicimonas sp. TaxID=2067044 RepID=UPI003A84DD4E